MVAVDGTVVRGGYGLFSALNQGSTYYAMRVENGVVQLNYSYSGCESTSWHSDRLKVPDPSGERVRKIAFPELAVHSLGAAAVGGRCIRSAARHRR